LFGVIFRAGAGAIPPHMLVRSILRPLESVIEHSATAGLAIPNSRIVASIVAFISQV